MTERLRAEHNAAQAAIAQLREQLGALQNAVDTLGNERDRERLELQSVRAQLDAAIRQAAADSARADELRRELQRHDGQVRAGSGPVAGPKGGNQRRRNVPDTADDP